MAVRMMPPGVEQWVWLNDFLGFGVAVSDAMILPDEKINHENRLDVDVVHFRDRGSCWFPHKGSTPRNMQDMNPSLALQFIDLMASHYPERLGHLVVLDAPMLMTPICESCQGIISCASTGHAS